MTRSTTQRVVAGVAGGLAERLGVDVILVRIAFAVLAFAGGAGVVLYALGWLLLPVEPDASEGAGRDGTRRVTGSAATAGGVDQPRLQPTIQQAVALGLITLGVLLLLRALGLWFGDALVWPLVIAAAGSAVVWTRGEARSAAPARRQPRPASGRGAWATSLAMLAEEISPVRVVIGTLLVMVGLTGFLAANDALTALRDLGVALVAAAVGLTVLFGPWLWRLADQLAQERRDRIRSEERADLAAHLHDSVLQTLALIQRSSDQPRRMVALARRQERELRAWLFGATGNPSAPTTLEEAVATLTEEVEATHDITVEVVVVGDCPVDDGVRALLAAVREACSNAAKHAGITTVDVFVEVEDDQVTAFVRDRGHGFFMHEVAGDRQGIRRSIVDRLERRGGSAVIASRPGEGTEVEMAIPRPRRHDGWSVPTHSAPPPHSSQPGAPATTTGTHRPDMRPLPPPTQQDDRS